MRIALLTFIVSALACTLAFAQGEAKPTPPKTLSWDELKVFFQPPEAFKGKLGDYRSVMKFDDGTEVKTPADWPRRRKQILDYWQKVMGPWPKVIEKPRINVLSSEHVENFTRSKVQVETAPGKMTGDYYLLVPDGKGPFPAVLVVFYGGEDAAGLNPKRPTLQFGYDLTKRGFVTLCIGGNVASGPKDIQPLSWLAYTAANCCNALAARDDVDAKRIAVMGHSFGGKWAMFASCLYDKFACAVWVDPGIVWNERDPNANYWERWYLGYDPTKGPKEQRKEGRVSDANPRTGAYKQLVETGHDMNELHALMAPRPFLVSGGAQDRPAHWPALNRTIALYRFLGYNDRIAMTTRSGHTPTPESNLQAYSFLEHFLKPGK